VQGHGDGCDAHDGPEVDRWVDCDGEGVWGEAGDGSVEEPVSLQTVATNVSREAYFQTIDYAPHSAAQAEYHNSKARFRVAVCGRRFGKSTMAGKDLEVKLLPGNYKRRFWIVGPTYDLGEKEFRVVWDDMIVRLQLGRDKRVKKSYSKKQGDMYIEFPWGSRVEVRSADHPESLVGDALDGVIMSEAAKHKQETWERFIRPALADRLGFADFPTTPEGYNWLYELWAFGQNPDIPEYASWKFPSWGNPHVYPEGRTDPEIRLLERTTAPEWFMQEIGADFASFVGKIFPEWDETRHVRKHKFNPAWPNYIAFDWGYTNPLAAIEFQVSPMDEVFVWREHYLAYTTLERHIEILKGRPQPEGYHLDLAFGDAADPEAALVVGTKLIPCLADPEAKTNWRQGIDLMRSFMRMREVGTADEYGTPLEKPGFFVDNECVNVISELNNYRAKDPIKGQNVPELGVKMRDHAIDALRYGLVHLFELGARHHLSEVMSPQLMTDVRPVYAGVFSTVGEFAARDPEF
jgi:hypothetical protein